LLLGHEGRLQGVLCLKTCRETIMPREVTDDEGIVWTCIQAFAGLGNDPEKRDAARVEGTRDKVHVVCTPSGAAHSVRIELPGDWETVLSDEALVDRIRSRLAEDG
jgi:hypothetical protein